MKKIVFLLALFAGLGGSAMAQEASKSKKATKARATAGAKKSTAAVAETSVAEPAVAEVAEVAEIREVPVFDENGNKTGTKRVKLDKDGNIIDSQAAREAKKAKQMEAEAKKSTKQY